VKFRKLTAPDGLPVEITRTPFPEIAQGIIWGATTATGKRYLVALDSTRSRKLQREALGHELAHIWLRHFERPKGTDPEEIENEANANAARYYRRYLLRLL